MISTSLTTGILSPSKSTIGFRFGVAPRCGYLRDFFAFFCYQPYARDAAKHFT
jgi:hypothetical protein